MPRKIALFTSFILGVLFLIVACYGDGMVRRMSTEMRVQCIGISL